MANNRAVLAVFLFSTVTTASALMGQMPPATLSIVPLGGTEIQGGSIVTLEIFLTVDADTCAGPESPTNPIGIRFRGGQIDLPCVISGEPGSSGDLTILSSGGATTDPDGDGSRGPSSGGIPFLFGTAGLGPFQAATCVIALTPPIGSSPVNVAVGQTRYLGTYYYQVSNCATGDFRAYFEGIDHPPMQTNTTRFRDDCPAGTGQGMLIDFETQDAVLTAPGPCSCVGSEQCDDANPCTDDACREGKCTFTYNENPCEDGLFCTNSDLCMEGACVGREPTCTDPDVPFCNELLNRCQECIVAADCDDENECTSESCSGGVCQFVNNANSCDDGLFCTSPDQCGEGLCRGLGDRCLGQICNEETDECVSCIVDADCSDGNPCTDDTCANGECVFVLNSGPCDDGQFCTALGVCQQGACMPTGPECTSPERPYCDEIQDRCTECIVSDHCNDDNPCTADSCASGSCIHAPQSGSCDDGLFCTIVDACANGACQGSGDRCPGAVCDEASDACLAVCEDAATCDDFDDCTVDECLEGTCRHRASEEPCTPVTLSIVPLEGTEIEGGSVVTLEVFLLVNEDTCADQPPGPLNPFGIRFEGGQIDVPCVLTGSPGAVGGVQVIHPGNLGGGTTDPDGDGARGPSSGGTAFLFDESGLGPFQPSTCILALTPGVGASSINVNVGQTRYLGSYFYEVSDCAGGDYPVRFEGIHRPPESTDTTRFREDCPADTSFGRLLELHANTPTLTVPIGRCCNGFECLGDLNRHCCLEIQGGRTWNPNATCADGCGCENDAECDDQNVCTRDACVETVCQYAPVDGPCDDGLFCTAEDVCLEGACQGSGDPCEGKLCNESLDACVPCLTGGDCMDDGNPCTDEVCTPEGKCEHIADDSNECDDGLFCTAPDQCREGTCRSGEAGPCDIQQHCLEDSDECVDCFVDSECADGNECTQDVCLEGECLHPSSPVGTPCGDPTVDLCDSPDTCDGQSHCRPNPVPDGTLCADELFCNGVERCSQGHCLAGPLPCGFCESCDEENDMCGTGSLPVLSNSSPACNKSLWRTGRNFVTLTFSAPVTLPGPGEVEILELLPDGAVGANLNIGGAFTMTVESAGHKLVIREQGSTLVHRKWYTVRNTGAWLAAAPFKIDLVVQMGDVSNDGRVLAADTSIANAAIPCPNCPDDRRDVNGDHRILAGDVSSINARIPSAPVAKPSGHECCP